MFFFFNIPNLKPQTSPGLIKTYSMLSLYTVCTICL